MTGGGGRDAFSLPTQTELNCAALTFLAFSGTERLGRENKSGGGDFSV